MVPRRPGRCGLPATPPQNLNPRARHNQLVRPRERRDWGVGWLAPGGPGSKAAAYGAVNAIQASVDSAAVLALGGWLLLVNSDFVRGRGAARVRASLGLLAACACLLAAVVPGAGPVGLALVLVWFTWLALDEV